MNKVKFQPGIHPNGHVFPSHNWGAKACPKCILEPINWSTILTYKPRWFSHTGYMFRSTKWHIKLGKLKWDAKIKLGILNCILVLDFGWSWWVSQAQTFSPVSSVILYLWIRLRLFFGHVFLIFPQFNVSTRGRTFMPYIEMCILKYMILVGHSWWLLRLPLDSK